MKKRVLELLIDLHKNGCRRVRDEEELQILQGFELSGMIKFGINFSDGKNEVDLTPFGRRYVESLNP
ncbi:MAG: hypothetical protein HW380_2298 [Magnetococcales bacterium]|nr:hypothetical protein [Magnetococcales bacterium]HIJ84334.1 hypothetical protein [Magnetococcales bacterium]